MKNYFIIMLSLFAMVSCAKSDLDNTPTRNRVQMSVSAVEGNNDNTRIEFNNSVYDMLWEADDQIGVFIAGTGEKATFTVSELSDDRKSARFSAEIYEPNAKDSYYAFYPATTPFGGSIASFVLPAETSGADAPLLVASVEDVAMNDVALSFKSVTAVLRLTLGFAADKVVIEGNNGEHLAGVYAYNLATDTPNAIAGSATITLTSANAKQPYYLYIPAINLEKGYKVTVEVDGQKMIKSVGYASGKKFAAGEVSNLNIDTFEPISVTLGDTKTSYSYYLEGNSATANSTDANTILFNGISTFSGISSTLVDEVGVYYGNKKIVGTLSGKSFTVANATGLSRGSYDVCAYVKVGDVEYKSATTRVHITGLPYEADWRSNDYSDWTYVNTSDSGNYVLYPTGKTSAVISPAFHIPASLQVMTKLAMVTNSTSIGNYLRTYINPCAAGTKSTNMSGTYVDVTMVNEFNPSSHSNVDWTSCNTAFTLTSSTPCLNYSHKEFMLFTSGALYRIRIDYK
ncbi:MAG: fimbrillin family protein [Alistipes sp.]|nr:fimbrillin family protein [Alistipes sp.]